MSLFNELKRRNVLRVAAAYAVASWLIIQVVETVFPAFGFGDAAVRIVTIVVAIGLLPALILSWAFEITPEGLKKEKDVDRSQSISPQHGKKLDRMIMVVLALALGLFAFDKFVLSESREASIAEEARQKGRSEAMVDSYGDKSIAVLPFVNMSDDASNEYFSDGISEELLNLLARIPELRVISRTSAFSYKDKEINLTEVARDLNVAHILEGSVRKSGNQVRITAQLIDARTDTHLWSQTYDRTLDNIFAIQDEIASEVVAQLKITLLGDAPTVRETDPEAYALVLQAHFLHRQFTPDTLERSVALLEQALVIDPDSAAAWAGLANSYISQAGRALRPYEEGFTLAREAANRALEIDPSFASAHASLARIARGYDLDFVAAVRHYERALAIEATNTDIIFDAAKMVSSLGRQDQAIAMAKYAVARDPVNPIGHTRLGISCIYAGRLDEAIASFRTTLTLSPGYTGTEFLIGIALLMKGEPEAALAAMQKESYKAWRMIGLVMTRHTLGQVAASDALLEELIEKYGKEWPYNIAYVLAFRGETDRAFKWLDKAVAYKDPGVAATAIQPLFANIYSDPRWLPFLESIGKSPDQLEAVEFEFTLPE